jgi:hypothetical protein
MKITVQQLENNDDMQLIITKNHPGPWGGGLAPPQNLKNVSKI